MARIGRLNRARKAAEGGSYMQLDDTRIPVYWDADFPEDRVKADICTQHIEEGTVADVEREFFEAECRFPAKGEPNLLRYRIECPGSCDIGKCAVRIVQYDASGNVIA